MISSVDNSSLISYVWTLATDLMNSKTPSIYNQVSLFTNPFYILIY